jgi:hypothetical protein
MDRTQVVDVTDRANTAGLPFRLAMTPAAWDRCIVEPRALLPADQLKLENYRLYGIIIDLEWPQVGEERSYLSPDPVLT